MDEEYQDKEIMKDLWSKEQRIRELEQELTEAVNCLNRVVKQLNEALEG